MLKDLWFAIGPGILKFGGETLIYTGQLLESLGVAMQEQGINLLEAKQRLEEKAKERQSRRQRIQNLRGTPAHVS
ncbi:hypothetical protein P74p39 [Thermus phage P74-26]|uniref:Uncharacterized protein n=1 Tax=Thermus phage P74-26 TaxID=2914007 RepID=A7XXK7_BP742|nr:hypothetical protein P74p39 [Thermus phage P74-26]ABU96989.1 hypothetical protein P74p39 [Thermus phage P74-26]